LVNRIIRVMQVDDVDAVHTQPLQALGKAAAHTIRREVPDPGEVIRDRETAGIVRSRGRWIRPDEPAHLGREDELAPRQSREGRTQPAFRQPSP
jgi:hypothetical protein